MKQPLRGDQLTLRYDGALLNARCDEIAETPARGPGAASFTIVSQTTFIRGREAQLIKGGVELAVQVERVTLVGHRRMNIVLLRGTFDTPTPIVAIAEENKSR